MPLVVNQRVGLRHDVLFLAVGGKIFNLFAYLAVFNLAIGCFQKAEFVDARESGQRRNQTNVRAFRRFNRANAAVVRRVHVADLETRPVAAQAARPQRAETALVGQFRQRIDLIHELAQLRAAEEIANDRRKRLGIDELLWRHRLDALVKQRHAFLDEALGAGQTDAALVGQQFTDRADAAAAEMVNVVERTFALLEPEQVLRRGNQIVFRQNARLFLVLQPELLVDFIAADAAQIIAFRVKEQTFEQRPGVRRGRRIPWTQPPVNILECLLLVFGRVFLKAFDHDALVQGRVHDLDFVDAQFGDLFDDGLRQRLERAGNDEPLFFIHGVLNQNAVRQILKLLSFLDREFLNFIKQLDDFLIGATGLLAVILALADAAFDIQKTQRAEERRRQKLPSAFLAVEINVKQVAGVKLRLVP